MPYNKRETRAANIRFVGSTKEKLRQDRRNKKIEKFKDNSLGR